MTTRRGFIGLLAAAPIAAPAVAKELVANGGVIDAAGKAHRGMTVTGTVRALAVDADISEAVGPRACA